MGLYASVVLVIGKFVREFFSGISHSIMFEELPCVDRILKLCTDIFLVRVTCVCGLFTCHCTVISLAVSCLRWERQVSWSWRRSFTPNSSSCIDLQRLWSNGHAADPTHHLYDPWWCQSLWYHHWASCSPDVQQRISREHSPDVKMSVTTGVFTEPYVKKEKMLPVCRCSGEAELTFWWPEDRVLHDYWSLMISDCMETSHAGKPGILHGTFDGKQTTGSGIFKLKWSPAHYQNSDHVIGRCWWDVQWQVFEHGDAVITDFYLFYFNVYRKSLSISVT